MGAIRELTGQEYVDAYAAVADYAKRDTLAEPAGSAGSIPHGDRASEAPGSAGRGEDR
jgi:hypothetical protein